MWCFTASNKLFSGVTKHFFPLGRLTSNIWVLLGPLPRTTRPRGEAMKRSVSNWSVTDNYFNSDSCLVVQHSHDYTALGRNFSAMYKEGQIHSICICLCVYACVWVCVVILHPKFKPQSHWPDVFSPFLLLTLSLGIFLSLLLTPLFFPSDFPFLLLCKFPVIHIFIQSSAFVNAHNKAQPYEPHKGFSTKLQGCNKIIALETDILFIEEPKKVMHLYVLFLCTATKFIFLSTRTKEWVQLQ